MPQLFHQFLTPVSSASSFSVNSPYKSHSIYVKIVKTPAFHYLALLLIVANTVYIGIDVDRDHNGQDYIVGDAFFISDVVFASLFAAEISLRILAYKSIMHYLTDPPFRGWRVFDIAFLIIVIMESFVFPYIIDYQDEYVLRPFRLFRLIRIFRLYMEFPIMAALIRSIVSSIPAVSVIMAFQLYLMYGCALLLVNWARSSPHVLDVNADGTENIFYDYFGEVYKAMLTLFQFLIVDSTFAVIDAALETTAYIGVLLMVYFAFSTMIVYNILIGGVCRAVANTAVAEKDREAVRVIKRAFKRGDPMLTGEVGVVNYEIKVRPILYKNEALDNSIVDIAKSISVVEDVGRSDVGDAIDQTTGQTTTGCSVNAELFTNAYLKLTRPIQAQDVANCLFELEAFYKLIDESLID